MFSKMSPKKSPQVSTLHLKQKVEESKQSAVFVYSIKIGIKKESPRKSPQVSKQSAVLF